MSGLIQNYSELLAVRFLMGTFEASLPAGATYLISMYSTKRQAALWFAWFINLVLAGPLFSGLLPTRFRVSRPLLATWDGVGCS